MCGYHTLENRKSIGKNFVLIYARESGRISIHVLFPLEQVSKIFSIYRRRKEYQE